MDTSATFSPCRRWRYDLWRRWDSKLPTLVVIGLNPSTADETQDDPTIRRCIGFARAWGYGSLCMLNLFAWRATDPRVMKAAGEPVGRDNDRTIQRQTRDRFVLCAWGNHGRFQGRSMHVVSTLRTSRRLHCLGVTKAGEPKHPLYLPSATTAVPLPEGACQT